MTEIDPSDLLYAALGVRFARRRLHALIDKGVGHSDPMRVTAWSALKKSETELDAVIHRTPPEEE